MIDNSTFQTLYQTYYPDDSLPYLLPEDLPLVNMLVGGNNDGLMVTGDVVDMPWLFGAPAGFSQTFATAQNQAANAPQAIRPQVRLSQAYKVMGFLDKAERQSQGPASYGDLMEVTVGGARMDFLSKLDQLMQGNGSGNVASFTWASATPTTITFNSTPTGLTGDTNGAALGAAVIQTMFEVNDQIVITTTNPSDGTSPTVTAGPFTVVSVDGVANTLVINANPNLTDGNVYGVAGAGNTMGFSSALIYPSIIGVGSYNPYGGVKSTDSFLGTSRFAFQPRLTGSWLDASSKYSIEGGAKKLSSMMRNSGVRPGGCIMMAHSDDVDALDAKLQTQQRYSQPQIGSFFFEGLRVSSGLGSLSIVVDPHRQKGLPRIYKPGCVQLMYSGGLPHFATLSNGTDEQWGLTYDGREKRLRAYIQTRAIDPRGLGVVKIAKTN